MAQSNSKFPKGGFGIFFGAFCKQSVFCLLMFISIIFKYDHRIP